MEAFGSSEHIPSTSWKVMLCCMHVQIYCSIVGLPARAIQWGAWHGVGMVAENSAVLTRMRRGGIDTVSPVMGLSALQALIAAHSAAPQVERCA